jgi:PAS domain-containing protein
MENASKIGIMGDEDARDRGEAEWLPNDPASTMDPALWWLSLTALASDNLSLITLLADGSRDSETMPLNDQIHSCGPDSKTSSWHSRPALLPAASRASNLPATLIRTLDGRICAWSRGMERRYGFPASRAIGLPLDQLLGTVSCRTSGEVDRAFLDTQTWSGGLIHHRSDGRPIMTAAFWHLRRKFNGEARFVTELHADIVPAGSAAGAQLADVLAAITHEMSNALTAVRLYAETSARSLRTVCPDRVVADQGLGRATKQIDRAIKAVRLMRTLREQLTETNRRETIKRQRLFPLAPKSDDRGRQAEAGRNSTAKVPPPAVSAAAKGHAPRRDAPRIYVREH